MSNTASDERVVLGIVNGQCRFGDPVKRSDVVDLAKGHHISRQRAVRTLGRLVGQGVLREISPGYYLPTTPPTS